MAPIPIIPQSSWALRTPRANVEINVAWGAGSGFALIAARFGSPGKPYAREERECDERAGGPSAEAGLGEHRKEESDRHRRENTDAGNRAIGRADQARHVTRDRRDEPADQQRESHATYDEGPGARLERRSPDEVAEEPADHQETSGAQDADRAERQVAVFLAPGLGGRSGPSSGHDPIENGADELD
jgi:hypothetical protein